ncbi:MAG: hypothetical protein ACR2KM_08770 [Gemmatimonadaceae bacterium]
MIHFEDGTTIATLKREVEAMRRVVEAAERWREVARSAEHDDVALLRVEGVLVRAVDEYRARTTG